MPELPTDLSMRIIKKVSPVTRKVNEMHVEATNEQWAAYDRGELIQRALPHLTKEVREFMISGTTPEDWEKLFGDEDEQG